MRARDLDQLVCQRRACGCDGIPFGEVQKAQLAFGTFDVPQVRLVVGRAVDLGRVGLGRHTPGGDRVDLGVLDGGVQRARCGYVFREDLVPELADREVAYLGCGSGRELDVLACGQLGYRRVAARGPVRSAGLEIGTAAGGEVLDGTGALVDQCPGVLARAVAGDVNLDLSSPQWVAPLVMAPSMRTLLAVGLLICSCWNSDVAELPALLFAVVLDVHAPRPSATATARARYDVCRPLAKLIT